MGHARVILDGKLVDEAPADQPRSRGVHRALLLRAVERSRTRPIRWALRSPPPPLEQGDEAEAGRVELAREVQLVHRPAGIALRSRPAFS